MTGQAAQLTDQRAVILEVITDHRRVRNVRSCTAKGCGWRPQRSGNTSDPEDTLARHHDFNAHLADVIMDRLAELCHMCGHTPHREDCEVVTGYDHLNGDHECGCPGRG